MAIPLQDVERLVRLLVWVGGAASTVSGAWVASKWHVYHDSRKAHLEDIKQRVLIPLRAGLEQHFRPLVFHLVPVIYVQMAATTEFHEKAAVTEAPTEEGDVLQGAYPGAVVFAPLDSALLEDARKSHFSKQLSRIDSLYASWTAHSGQCHIWVRDMAKEILMRSGLPAFPNRVAPEYSAYRPYVMHYRLAVFVYKRLFRIGKGWLTTEHTDSLWGVSGDGATLAIGSKEQVESLVSILNGLLESQEATARALKDNAGQMQTDFLAALPPLDHAIASRRLRGRCDLVTFF
jgi:hypothetical protein